MTTDKTIKKIKLHDEDIEEVETFKYLNQEIEVKASTESNS